MEKWKKEKKEKSVIAHMVVGLVALYHLLAQEIKFFPIMANMRSKLGGAD